MLTRQADVFRRLLIVFIFFGFTALSHAEPANQAIDDDLVISPNDFKILAQASLAIRTGEGIEAAEARIKSATEGDINGIREVAYLFEELKLYEKARLWYGEGSRRGDPYSLEQYAGFLLEAKGGDRDLTLAFKLYRHLADIGQKWTSAGYIDFLEKMHHNFGFDTSVSRVYWYEVYGAMGIELPEGEGEAPDTNGYYVRIADFYSGGIELPSYQYGLDAHYDKRIEVARDYYLKAGNEKKARELDVLIKPLSSDFHKLSPEVMGLCDTIFNHKKRDYLNFQQAQRGIFDNPAMAKTIAESYHAGKLSADNSVYPDSVMFHFPSLSLEGLLSLFITIGFGVDENPNIHFDESLRDINVMVVGQRIHLPSYINIVLETYGVDVSCSGGKISFSPPKNTSVRSRLFTDLLITEWSEDIKVSDSELSGEGDLIFEDLFVFSGPVKASLPQGKGIYIFKDTVYSAGSIVDGILSGQGEYIDVGKLRYQGDFSKGEFTGSGRILTYGYHYIGDLKAGKPHGKGVMEHIEIEANKEPQFLYPLNEMPPVIAYYKGEFFEDHKHGVGQCGIKNSDNTYDNFECTFYLDNLIAVNGISLLPVDAPLQKHFDVLVKVATSDE